jgi:hypothetical protein
VSVYTYPQSKVIDKITFLATEKGGVRAYMHASAASDPDALYKITLKLSERGFLSTPGNLQGEPVLEVRGLKKPEQLINILQDNAWIAGPSQRLVEKEKPQSFLEHLKKNSLKASSYFFAVGDLSMLKYGFAKNALEKTAAVFYTIPTPFLYFYGTNDQSQRKIKDVAKQLRDYLKKEGENLPKECSLEVIAADHKQGLIKTTDDLLKRYPAEVMNLCYSVAGACYLAHGSKMLAKTKIAPLHKKNWPRVEAWSNLGVGISTTTAGLTSTLVREKKHDPDAPEKQGMAKAWQWVQEHPLALAGYGYMLSTVCHAVSTYAGMQGESKKEKNALLFRGIFVGATLIAELLVSISSKGHGEGVVTDQSVDNSIISMAADLIAKRSPRHQEELIGYISGFLGRPDVLAMKNQVVATQLRTQVELMRKNPWAMCHGTEQGAENPAVPDTMPALAERGDNVTLTATPAKLASWQAKRALEKAAPSQPSLSN